jgi:hypothetical protein
MARELGGLYAGARADMIAVPIDSTGDTFETVLNHRGAVRAAMIGGEWAIAP